MDFPNAPGSAPTFLGMKQRAFDLLVAAYRDIFMRIMKDEKMWVIPEVYLKGLSQNEDFPLVKAKYELLASRAGQMRRMTRATPTIQPARKDRWRPGLFERGLFRSLILAALWDKFPYQAVE